MKERNDLARCVACVAAVQLFALAVYFCLYALIAGGAFYSLSEKPGKIIMISASIVIAVLLCVVNVFTVIRSKKVYITRPDIIALRNGQDVVGLAYRTARPVLIYKITSGLVLLTIPGLVYISLDMLMEDKTLAGLYGRIVCCLFAAAFVLIALPCIDRIACYRALLNETHTLYCEEKHDASTYYIIAFAVPVSVCVWYILRFYASRQDISFVVFPTLIYFTLAFVL